jgi:hypothetical protein
VSYLAQSASSTRTGERAAAPLTGTTADTPSDQVTATNLIYLRVQQHDGTALWSYRTHTLIFDFATGKLKPLVTSNQVAFSRSLTTGKFPTETQVFAHCQWSARKAAAGPRCYAQYWKPGMTYEQLSILVNTPSAAGGPAPLAAALEKVGQPAITPYGEGY